MGALVGILFSLVLFGAIDLPFVQLGGLEERVSNLDIQTPVVSLAGTDLVFLLEFFAIHRLPVSVGRFGTLPDPQLGNVLVYGER